jgi:hypothetical protein
MPRRFLTWLISPTEFRILSVVLVYEPTERFRKLVPYSRHFD